MASNATQKRLEDSKLKLNALLEVTQAINQNKSPEELLTLMEKFLVKDLNIGKIAIFKKNGEWNCIYHSGCDISDCDKIDIEKQLLPVREITSVVGATGEDAITGFDYIIPVINNNVMMAYVLIGDIVEGEGISPLIKHFNFIQTITNIVLVAIENIRLFQESLEQERMKKELELAKKMQTLLIPDNSILPSNHCLRVWGFYQPHFSIGGDYYDCIQLSRHTYGFCIADVSGKGISAALLMANFQANLRALYTYDIPLKKLIRTLNQRVVENANGEKFITLFLAKYNCETRILEYVNAAHNPPVVYLTEDDKILKLHSNTVGIGMLDEMPDFVKETLKLNQRTKIICYTDGLSELPDENEKEIGTAPIEKNISNQKDIYHNIQSLIREEDITPENSRCFDDVSILGVEIF
ncbi:MAG TPA: serine/threonine protein phosphatase [Bacteroidetes bacterium]|nr:serine/threonine protein phosphatase [Bacteroidota bacterium]